MKISLNGIELPNAVVKYGEDGKPIKVLRDATQGGIWQPAEQFTFEEAKTVKKTKEKPKKKTKKTEE